MTAPEPGDETADPIDRAGRVLDRAMALIRDGDPGAAISLLRRAIEILAPVEPEPPLLGLVEYNLADTYRGAPGDPEDNRDAAIELLESCVARDLMPALLSRAYGSLGDLYARRRRGDTADNQERAIEAYRAVLPLAPPLVAPSEWAINSHNLGLTLLERVTGDPVGNAAEAVSAHWQAAAATLGVDQAWHERALGGCVDALFELVNRLAAVARPSPYEVARPMADRPTDGVIPRARATVGVLAMERGGEFLVWTGEADRVGRMFQIVAREAEIAGMISLQATALLHAGRMQRLLSGRDPERVEAARADFAAAIMEIDPELHPWAWEQARRELAELDAEVGPRPAGELDMPTAVVAQDLLTRALAGRDRIPPGDEQAGALVEEAIDTFRRALSTIDELDTLSDFHRRLRVTLRGGLAVALSARPWLRDAADAEAARAQLEVALDDIDRTVDPGLWAGLRHNLGLVYQNRVVGDIAANRELAVEYLEAALAEMADDEPSGRGRTLTQLGNAYTRRLRGDIEDNLDRALRCYDDALLIRTPERDPVGWAIVQHNRGMLYGVRRRGDAGDNRRAAVECFSAALRVRTRDSLPEHWAMTRRELGKAYLALGDPRFVAAAEECLRDTLVVYRRETAPVEWAATQFSLAQAARRRDDFDAAARILAQLHDVPLELQEPTLWSRVLAMSGDVALHRGLDSDDAAERWRGLHALRQALERFQRDSDLMAVREVGYRLAIGLMASGRPDLAAGAFQAALDADASRYAASISLATREIELQDSEGLASEAATAYLLLGRYDQAVTVLERSRARMLGEALARDRADLRELLAGDATASQAAQRFLSAATRVRTLEAMERGSDAGGVAG